MGTATLFSSTIYLNGFGGGAFNASDADAVLTDAGPVGNVENTEFTVGEILSDVSNGGQVGTFVGTLVTPSDTFLVVDNAIGYTLFSTKDLASSNFPSTFNVADVSGLDTDAFPACFLTGTSIATETGEKRVEHLQIGDRIRTVGGGAVAVKWIGRQTVSTLFRMPERLQPVRVRAGALGDGLPLRDLTLTADHALLIDGLLINAGALVNGGSIDWVPLSEFGDRYTVYHIETEDHDIILAEGTPAETFIDYVGRQAFDNYAEYVDLYGEDRTIPEMDTPRISAARMLPAHVRARLAGRRVA